MAINMDDMPDSLRLSIAGSASNPDSHASLTLSSPRLRRIPICGALPSSFHPHINAILDSPSRVLRHITILCLDVHRQPALHIPAAASTPFTINRLSVITVLSIDQASAVTILRCCTSAVSITLSTSPNIFVFDDDGRSSSGHSILGETVAKLSYLVTLDLTNLGGNRSASSSPVQCSHLAPSPSQILQGRTRSGTWRDRGQQPANSQQRRNTLPLWSFRKPAATSIPNLRPPTKIPLIRDPFPSIPIGGLTEGTFSAFNATNTLDLARASASTLKCLYAHSDWNWRYHDRPYDYVTEFPRLEQLALKLVLRLVDANDQWSAVNLIAHISTPILRKLLIVVPLWPDVDATGIPNPGPVSYILHKSDFFMRCRPQLMHIHLLDQSHSLFGDRIVALLDQGCVGPTLRTLILQYESTWISPGIHTKGIYGLYQYLSDFTTEGKFNVPLLKSFVLLMHESAIADPDDGDSTDMLELRFRHTDLSFAGLEFPCRASGDDHQEDRRQAETFRQNGWDTELMAGNAVLHTCCRQSIRKDWLRKADFTWNTFPAT
ncbi:hypothetical protein BDV98DRAFT_596694 [Pterulicium gracile]|uniref:Uncharacterized protein n=1 Tax=Pterulicium gracile TaxID=1884261 RepID=A0A5C3Q5V2_9AGAR|nr:hypothetical protein BDV98DRAFT_596694 [Pterula gracilis]